MTQETHSLKACLERARRDALSRRDGEVASYIPELATIDPELFALAVCSIDGEITSVGDDTHELTLQSVSKPFVYGRALELLGAERVREHLGVQPSGDPFDAIIELDRRNRPHNPMVNAGAISVAGMLAGHGESIGDLLQLFESYAGRPLTGVDATVYLSERTAGHRNRAIAHLMRHLGMLDAPVAETLDLYFQQCSVLVTCRDLAVMAATLANGGRNPLTGEQVIPESLVRPVLTVMFTCGFYDAAGRFAFEFGLPAKSGVSGAVLAVAPGRHGIAAFSPRLDRDGSSVRATLALGQVVREQRLHLLEPTVPRDPSRTVDRQIMEAALRDAFQQIDDLEGGAAAGYLPELPDELAIAVCGVDGEELAVGAADTLFSMQSVANPFAYGLALAEHGLEAVHARVGVEPSDNPFNAIHFDERTNKPFHPLGNAGAIAVCSLAPGPDAPTRLRWLLDGFSAFAGGERRVVDARVLEAEKAAGDRNRAIASLLRNFGVIDDEASALELYLQQCSLRTTCRQLARMGATLAGGGVQPQSGATVLAPELVRHVLTVMLTCGLHDESGRFAFDVGIPAKTGIAGGIVAALPGRMGIAAFSPKVNEHGSSVRGSAALEALSQRLRLSVFDNS